VTKEELEKVAIEALMFITTVVIPEMEKRFVPGPPLTSLTNLVGLKHMHFPVMMAAEICAGPAHNRQPSRPFWICTGWATASSTCRPFSTSRA